MKLVFGILPEKEKRERKKARKIPVEEREFKQIGKMHRIYGVTEGETCKRCTYFIHVRPGQNTYRKCRVFGITGGPATDWKARYPACGKFEAKEKV